MAESQKMHHVRNVATGVFTDNGRMGEQKVGFKPRHVRVVNLTDLTSLEWFDGMDDAHALKNATNGTLSKLSSNGITVSGKAFSVGNDNDVNPDAEEDRFWIAIG